MSDKREQYIEDHSSFYMLGYRKLINALFVLLAIIFLLLAFIIYQHFTRPVQKFFATTIDGRLIEITPLNRQ